MTGYPTTTQLLAERDRLRADLEAAQIQVRVTSILALMLTELGDHVTACQLDLCPTCSLYRDTRTQLTQEVGR